MIPSLDLGRSLAELGPELDAALREVGFVTVRNHGVPDDLRDRYFDAIEEFFAMPLSDTGRSRSATRRATAVTSASGPRRSTERSATPTMRSALPRPGI
jgi:isopenicillin N synthase-like dioxygenase